MVTEPVQLALIQGAVVLIPVLGAHVLAYLKIREGQTENLKATQEGHAETTAQVADNTEKTVEVGKAVNGRMDERLAALEEAHRARVEALEAQVAALRLALDATKKDAKPGH